jgi:small subunit ribosomal protein S17
MADKEEEKEEKVDEAPVEEPAAEEPETEAPVEEPAAEEPAPEAAPAAEAEPPPPTHPKEVRRLARRTHTGEAGPQRSPEERQRERDEARRAKAAQHRAWRAKSRAKAKQRSAAAAPAETPAPAPRGPGNQKLRQGVVVSDRPDKTITVRIDIARRHRRYEKIVRSSSTLHVHDERNEAHVGDTVRVVETRPLSRTKRWRLVEVLERAR